VTHGVVDAIGGFFSGVGRVAHDIASAVGGFFSKIGADLHRDLDIVRVVFVTVFAIWLGMWIAIGKVLLKPVLDEFHRLVPVVGAIMSAVGTTMRAAWDFVSGMVGAAASAIGTTARRAWDAISEAVGGAMSAIGATVHAAWNDIAAFFGPIFSAIGTTFHEAWSALSAWIGSIMSAIGTTIHNAWNAVAEFVGPIMSQIGAAVHDGWNNVWNTVTTWTGRIRDVAQGVWDAMVRAAESAGTGIWNGIKSGLNSAIGVLNSFIDNSNDFLGHFGVPKVSHIPKLAAGGVVDRPTLAMIGEGGGPEVVIPTEISKRQRGMDLWRQAGEMMGIRGMGAGAGAPSMTPGDWGGQCVQLVETVTGHHFDVMAAAEMCKYVNSSIAKAGEIFVSTLGQFGHTGFVLGGGKVLDSNWALDERIQIHNLSDIPDICGYIDGIPASLAAVSGISLKAKVDEWIGGLEKTFGTDWTGQMERGLLNIAGNAIKSILPFDTGGTLPTGISTVFNGTGRGEPVLGSRAEDHLAAIRQSMGGRPQEIHTHVHLGNEEFCTLVQHIEDRRLGQLMSAT
jgi:phage-related protein